MYGSRVKHFTRFYTFSLYGDIGLVLGPEPLIQGPYISQFTKMMDIVNMHLGVFFFDHIFMRVKTISLDVIHFYYITVIALPYGLKP